MNAQTSLTSAAAPTQKLKLCGNCNQVTFSITEQETMTLTEAVNLYGIKLIRDWLTHNKIPKLQGNNTGKDQTDFQKKAIIQLLKKHVAPCPSSKANIYFVEEACYAWLPAGQDPQNAIGLIEKTLEKLVGQ